jgi:putative nucleotidyltransferase with HDIG domain
VANLDQSVWRRAATALEEEPEDRWLPLVVHHGGRVLLLLAAAVAIYLLFPAPRLPDAAVFERGVVATHDVIAQVGFDIPKSYQELQREQQEAASGVPPVYVHDPVAGDSVLAGVNGLFAAVDSIIAATEGEERRSQVRAFMEQNRTPPTLNSIELFLDAGRRNELRESIERAVRTSYPLGVVPSSLSTGTSTIRVELPSGLERFVVRDSIITPERFYSGATEFLGPGGADAVELQRLILIRFFQPSLVYDEARTEAARERARAAVDPVRARVLQGEKIVGAHEQIGEAEEERLRAYEAELRRIGAQDSAEQYTVGLAVGGVLFNALILSILGFLLFFFRRPLYHDWRPLLMLVGLILTVAIAASFIARFELPIELIPVTFAALIVAALWDARLGLVVALVLAVLIGSQTPFLGVTTTFTAAIGGAAAAFSVRVVHRRTRTWHYIALVSAAYTVAAITMGFLRGRGMEEVGLSIGWSVTNAIVASLLALGFLPLFEVFARVTTDQTLLELSDLNRKLLKRLSLEAPGSYAHTIAVANLAEAAANAIGANGLLARVGTYYHDIGKLVKPQYFIENQPRGRNPHDKLKPATSASIIRNHVQEGLKLADQDKLPEVVKRFIPEHHGTQQISYFLNKARELDPDAQVNPVDFSYPGPKPQSKETAILMLADTVESAARVLADATPPRLREMIDRLVAQKIDEGQLSQSPLTLREVDQIKDSFTNVLAGMYHQRIDYPSGAAAAKIVASTGGGDPSPADIRTVAAGQSTRS